MAPDLVRRDYKRKVTRTLTRHDPIPAFYTPLGERVSRPFNPNISARATTLTAR